MIDLTFAIVKDGNLQTPELIVITVYPNKTLRFAQMKSGIPMYSMIEGLRLDPSGIVKEFPDLEGKPIPEMKRTAIKRFKEHIKNLNTIEEVKQYLKSDLIKHGYKLIMSQRKGFRPQKEV